MSDDEEYEYDYGSDAEYDYGSDGGNDNDENDGADDGLIEIENSFYGELRLQDYVKHALNRFVLCRGRRS